MDKQRILIVEDDHELSEMLDTYFRVQNYDVLTAFWGEDALKISREESLDLIVLDIRLPDIDGYEVCRELRRNRRTQDTPIIFLTERRERSDRLHGLELGVVDYITKPFDLQELSLRVRNAILRAERHVSIHPVTELPDDFALDERMEQMLYNSDSWAVLMLQLYGLPALRDAAGFVAADEVLRAVTLMVKNAVREFGTEQDFIGHIAPEGLAILTRPECIGAIRERIESRIRPSIRHFYPFTADDTDLLTVTSCVVGVDAGPFETIDDIKGALYAAANSE